MLGDVSDEGSRGVVRRGQMVFAALQFEDVGKFSIAQAARCFHDGVENRLKLDCGSVDGVQDIVGSFLPLQRLGQFAPKVRIFFFCIEARRRAFARRQRFAGRCRLAHRFAALRHRGALRPGKATRTANATQSAIGRIVRALRWTTRNHDLPRGIAVTSERLGCLLRSGVLGFCPIRMECPNERGGLTMSDANRLFYLRIALIVIGLTFIFGIYPLSIVWPSGWTWGQGRSHYLMMIIGIYATLGVFLLIASQDPDAHRSIIWFTIWSSVVHGAIMAAQSSSEAAERGHLLGDVPALFLIAIILAVLTPRTKTAPVRA